MRRPLLLTGFMGTGKSTVGKRISAIMGASFVDLDLEIEREAGLPIRRIFDERGEPHFRALETACLERVLARPGAPVVALGGGALVSRKTRLAAIDRAVVVTLEATPEEIMRRTASSEARPLLDSEDRLTRIEELLSARRSVYAECHARIVTTSRSADEVARDALAVWSRDPIAVAAGAASYVVEVGTGVAPERIEAALTGASLALLVTDENVAPHHAGPLEAAIERSGMSRRTLVLAPGEEHKNTAALERIWLAAQSAGADRKSRFVALGGGVVSDITGFAAATWMRGASWVSVPTTLLSMVDASVGGKTAIDLGEAKNAVGAFFQPKLVLCDIAHLSTEKERGFTSALAEVIKTALIGDPELLSILERANEAVRRRDPDVIADVVRRSVRVKARVVSEDEREDGVRAWLNLGHTVGHALEAYGGYGKHLHGEAISLGLIAALRIGERLGITEPRLTERCVAVLSSFGLPTAIHHEPLREASALIGHDKKRTKDRLKFVAARDVGRVEIVDLGLPELRGHLLALGA